jgi:hypothetical protein
MMKNSLSLPIAGLIVFAALANAQTDPKPIAIHEHEISGVDLVLIEVSRTGPETVTVKWEYRNKTKAPIPLATHSSGWSDPYRLSWDTYLTDEATNAKFPVLKDSDGHPIAAVHGKTFDKIVLGTVKPLKTWAKYNVPANVKKVTVVITGAEPFERVAIGELQADSK